MPTQTTVAKTRLGDYLKLIIASETSKKTWIRGPYNRSERKYEITNADDANDFRFIRGGFPCVIGFTY